MTWLTRGGLRRDHPGINSPRRAGEKAVGVGCAARVVDARLQIGSVAVARAKERRLHATDACVGKRFIQLADVEAAISGAIGTATAVGRQNEGVESLRMRGL